MAGWKIPELNGGFHRKTLMNGEWCIFQHAMFDDTGWYYWLVVWNIFYFSIYFGIIIPIDNHIFQRG